MKQERNSVEFPLWRKKVDKSLFDLGATPVPGWACEMWKLSAQFSECRTLKDPQSCVTIRFLNQSYEGWVTYGGDSSRRSRLVRLWFEDSLKQRLRQTYLMSYMRSLEHELSDENIAVTEARIPFWEFLDIEFDRDAKTFHFLDHYKQAAPFPHLFSRLVGSPNLARVSDEILGKDERRIQKQDWAERGKYRFEVGAKNVIYLLADSKKQLLYVGETDDLVARFDRSHNLIPDWDRYRYDVLPEALREFRVSLERMLIRYLAALMPNGKNIVHLGFTEYRLVNAKVDS